jgi:hypothetical protein
MPSAYKIEDHQPASELLGQFLNRAKKKWERPGVVDLRSGRTRWRPCEPFRILVTSVKDTFPFGVAVHAYIDPLGEPSRKRYTPRRHYSKPNWLDS